MIRIYGENVQRKAHQVRVKILRFIKVCKIYGVKVNAEKNKMMRSIGEEGSVCEVSLDGKQL